MLQERSLVPKRSTLKEGIMRKIEVLAAVPAIQVV
jgi:hypothetical protein